MMTHIRLSNTVAKRGTIIFLLLVALGGLLPSDSADFVAYAVCHRLIDHSFTVFGRALPLCARCTGIYFGLIGVVAYRWIIAKDRRGGYPHWSILLLFALFVGLMGIDGLNSMRYTFSFNSWYRPNNGLRFITGLATGLAIGGIILPAWSQTMWAHASSIPIIGRRDVALLLLGGLLITLPILYNQPTVLSVMGSISALGVILIFTLLYAILTQIIRRKDGQATQWRELMVPHIVGLIITCLQIGTVGILRYHWTGTWAGF